MMTAGRRPDSMREMRDESSAEAGDWLGAAESFRESTEELETAIARKAKIRVRRVRAFVVADRMGDLMGGNRTTFECGRICLVGWWLGEI